MRFELNGQHVLYYDEVPGNHATLFDRRGEKLRFAPSASSFDDAAHRYTWAFVAEGTTEGSMVCFATADREVVGLVGEAGELVPLGRYVSRDEAGKPVKIS